MEKLPLEIAENLQSRLPVVSRLQCREVCTKWRNSFPKSQKGLLYEITRLNKENEIEAEFYFSKDKSDQVINTTKLDHSLIMPGSVYQCFMVGSCNGLVCYAARDYPTATGEWETKVYVSNPVTGEHIQLPSIRFVPMMVFGFGYARSSNEYKVVRMHCDYYASVSVQVYTLQGGGGGNGWRNVMIQEGLRTRFYGLPTEAVFTDGALHWMNLDCHYKPNILAFDLEHETFNLLPAIPSDISITNFANHVRLMELGGNLCAIEAVPKRRTIVWELNRQKKSVKHGPYWHKMFTIKWEDYGWFEPKFNACVLYCNVIISCYDPETRTLKKLEETLRNSGMNLYISPFE